MSKPRVRVEMRRRLVGPGVPDDAQPGDLVVRNRGEATEVLCSGQVMYLGWRWNIAGIPPQMMRG